MKVRISTLAAGGLAALLALTGVKAIAGSSHAEAPRAISLTSDSQEGRSSGGSRDDGLDADEKHKVAKGRKHDAGDDDDAVVDDDFNDDDDSQVAEDRNDDTDNTNGPTADDDTAGDDTAGDDDGGHTRGQGDDDAADVNEDRGGDDDATDVHDDHGHDPNDDEGQDDDGGNSGPGNGGSDDDNSGPGNGDDD